MGLQILEHPPCLRGEAKGLIQGLGYEIIAEYVQRQPSSTPITNPIFHLLHRSLSIPLTPELLIDQYLVDVPSP